MRLNAVATGPRKHIVAAFIGVLLTLACRSAAAEFVNPKLKPPRAKPHRRSAAEGIPPLPLPATPLRRTERKRQPAPPALVGMINFSRGQFKMVGGKRTRSAAFPTTQIDIERLMHFANQRLNIRYRYMSMNLRIFSWDPEELPLLYVTGWTAMPELSDLMIQKLRRYIYDGGTLVMHAQCGRPEFTQTARRQIKKLFPRRELAPLDSDSPVFSAYYNIRTMQFRKDDQPHKAIPPYLEAVYVGCRPGVILSPIDLNCTWDTNIPIRGGILYNRNDGLRLGVNIITMTLGNFQYARAFSTQKVFHEQGDKTRDQLVIAQLVHNGDWDPTPQALPSLMKYIQKNTTLNVQFKREVVNLTAPNLFDHQVLYMTGLRKFKLSDVEVGRLRKFLSSGGLLVADAAAGRAGFDAAFRSEMKRVLPKAELKTLAPDSPVYQLPFKVRSAAYTPIVKAESPQLKAPSLQGISIDGQLAVIYSPYSLSNGWESLGFAYNRGYETPDALRLGVNVFAYALTH